MENKKQKVVDTVNKFVIKLKSKPKDGVILQLHHTIRESNGENRRIRFTTGSFDDNQERLACADNAGNIFILDFSELKFWKLTDIGACSALYFLPNLSDILAVATVKKFDIVFLDIETGKVSRSLSGHTAAVKHISYSNSKTNNLLTSSAVEAILWELTNYTKYFTLNTYLGAQIQQILFTPVAEYLVACFQNDTIQIWKHESMKSVKQIIPSDLKHLKNVAFTMNGRAMAIAGLTPTLILFNMDTWKAIKSINLSKYNFSGALQIAFIPQMFDGGANKILAILGSDCSLYLLNLESLNIVYTIMPDSSGIRKFTVSPTGKYFVCILQQGEVNIYNSSFVMDLAKNVTSESITKNKDLATTSSQKCCIQEHAKSRSKAAVEQKMKICMDSARLRRILMQYGEYPDKFRSIIWRSLLDTPRNKSAYTALIDKGIHPSYKDIEKQFTIHSSVTLKNLKRLLSCLSHWCPLFGVMKFLPGFVFPFVKVLQKDPLLLFECTATVLINHCQLWFEYAPFPPISILAMVENILAEHDHQLLTFFCEVGVTSQTYALKILETAFSEVLTCSEWLILWDHILSNEPAFILMAVVSYNIVQKNAIKKLKTHEQLENFFHMQNPIDKKTFLKKTYLLINETSDDIHPRRFYNSFTSLEKGECYQQFTGYPKATICLKLAKQNRKKILKSDRYTLKELTTKSQEKEINEKIIRADDLTDSRSIQSDDNSIYASHHNSSHRHKHSKQFRKKPSSCKQNKGDYCNKTAKETLIESVLYPASTHRNKEASASQTINRKDNINLCKYNSKSKTRKKEIETQISHLEKEVEKLMSPYTMSNESD